MSLRVELVGFRELSGVLRRVADSTPRVLDELMAEFAGQVESQAEMRVHVETGFLRRSIRSFRRSRGEFVVEASASYAGFEEYRVGGKRYSGSHAYLRPALRYVNARFRSKIVTRFKEMFAE